MRKNFLFVSILLLTITLFLPWGVSQANWSLHRYVRGYPTEVRGIAWVSNTEFIIGGRDHDDNDAWLRRMNVNGSVVWSRRVRYDDKIRSLDVGHWDHGSSNPGFVAYGFRYADRVEMRYTSDGNWRGLVFSHNHDIKGVNAIAGDGFGYGPRFATGYGDGFIDVWDLSNRSAPRKKVVHRAGRPIMSLVLDGWLSPVTIFVADGDNNVDERTAVGNLPIDNVYGNHSQRVNTIAIYAFEMVGDDLGKSALASGGDDNYIRIYNLNGRHELMDSFKASNGDINSVDFGPNAEYLSSCGDGNSVRIWAYNRFRGEVTSLLHTTATTTDAYVVKFSPRGDYVAAGTHEGTYILKKPFIPNAPKATGTPTVETALLSNYPNPFNPETWIPYHLAKPANVTIEIHASDGTLIRTLKLGRVPAGTYQDKDGAAYWDGKNEQGESVASGVYFYTLKAGEFSATKKMLIQK